MRPDSSPSTEQSAEMIDFAGLKAKILAGTPLGWRARVFHPAWPVAAGVFLASAILIHVSPRRNAIVGIGTMPTLPRAARISSEAGTAIQKRLPESRPASSAAGTLPLQPDSLLLIEAEAALELETIPAGAEIMLLTPLSGLPPLIDRPRSLDIQKLALDLAVLAGMQIGAGEWDDAGRTIVMLRRYLPEKAAELDEALIGARSLPSFGLSIDSHQKEPAPARPAKVKGLETGGHQVAETYTGTPEDMAESAGEPLDGGRSGDFSEEAVDPAASPAADPEPAGEPVLPSQPKQEQKLPMFTERNTGKSTGDNLEEWEGGRIAALETP
ncbi:MAG: hypothetical protein LBE84_11825, partial [Planctomycetota bacterium]|nr:hypothetical protein [Planctomycetota bacterium]